MRCSKEGEKLEEIFKKKKKGHSKQGAIRQENLQVEMVLSFFGHMTGKFVITPKPSCSKRQ